MSEKEFPPVYGFNPEIPARPFPEGLLYETPDCATEEEARAEMYRALGQWAEKEAGTLPFFFRSPPLVRRSDMFDGDGPTFRGRFRIGFIRN